MTFINTETGIFNRGKYKGGHIGDVMYEDSEYINWLLDESEIDDKSKEFIEGYLEGEGDFKWKE